MIIKDYPQVVKVDDGIIMKIYDEHEKRTAEYFVEEENINHIGFKSVKDIFRDAKHMVPEHLKNKITVHFICPAKESDYSTESITLFLGVQEANKLKKQLNLFKNKTTVIEFKHLLENI